jgi:class 3 adenylate cyclase
MTDTLSRAAAVKSRTLSQGRQRMVRLIVFLDLTNFQLQSERIDDAEIAETIDGHYRRVTRAIQAAGGRVIKFIGDATMAVFPEQVVDGAVRAIFDIRAVEDLALGQQGWNCRLHAKAHFGEVVGGVFGVDDDKRFDIFGKAVNRTAKLTTTGFTVSAEAYARLSPELQRRFKHQSATQTYVAD